LKKFNCKKFALSVTFGITEELPFLILDENAKSFPKFNTTVSSLSIKVRLPGEGHQPTA